eukprot:COSAG06_NODE_17155_length_958_cov_1.315483_2_plen_65_part_01
MPTKPGTPAARFGETGLDFDTPMNCEVPPAFPFAIFSLSVGVVVAAAAELPEAPVAAPLTTFVFV